METGLEKEIVIVTGATGGIGTAICKEFMQEGSIVFAVYRGKIEKLHEVSNWLVENKKFKELFHPIEMDISSTDSVKIGIANIIQEFGKIDVLVNCAGFSLERPFLLTEEEDWNKVIDVNLSVAARLCRIVLKPMFKAKKGAVVNISSVLSSRFGRGDVAYSAAKAGMNRFTQALAMEVASKGIRINAICPGLIETKMSSSLNFRLDKVVNTMTPMQRIGKPEEVAKSVIFLASSKTASFITGTTLYVDGGISI